MPGLLLVVAHPDDEIFCSGLLAHVAGKDIPLHIVCLTRGEGGQLGEPPLATNETLPVVREEEMKQAAAVLGATNLVFLDYVDPKPDGSTLRAPDHEPAKLVREIAVQIQKFDPDVVLTHGSTGDYGHPAHILVHNMTRVAAEKSNTVLYSFNAFFPGSGRLGALNRADWATFLFDGSQYSKQRFESFWKHATQWLVFVGAKSSENEYREALEGYFSSTSLESYCRQLTSSRGQDLMQDWVREYRSDPPNSGLLVQMKYKLLWTMRDAARRVKRLIIK